MRHIAVISGKGGTGKTTFSSTIHSFEGDVVADCDVDAPNLHLLLQDDLIDVRSFYSGEKASITDKCKSCGICSEVCRFDAIKKKNERFLVDIRKCEGCAFCYHVCPHNAITMEKVKTGEIYLGTTKYGHIVYAKLNPGEENSGKLVTEVKEMAKKIANEFIVVDAPPGIGCPVMAALAGVDAAIVVTEPTLSGMSDMIRAVKLAEIFRIKTFVVVNKWNLNQDVTKKIELWCKENDVEFAGKVPYDSSIIEQMSSLKFPFEGEASEKILEIWKNLRNSL